VHAAAVLFETARTGQRAASAAEVDATPKSEPRPSTVNMRTMSGSERLKVMQMVKDGQMSIAEAEAYVLRESPDGSNSTSPTHAPSQNPFRRHSVGTVAEIPEVPLSTSPEEDPFANPITRGESDPFTNPPSPASPVSSVSPDAPPKLSNPFGAADGGADEKRASAPSNKNPFAASAEAAFVAMGPKISESTAPHGGLHPFFSPRDGAEPASAPVDPTPASFDLTPSRKSAPNPFTSAMAEAPHAAGDTALNPFAAQPATDDTAVSPQKAAEANPFTKSSPQSGNPFN